MISEKFDVEKNWGGSGRAGSGGFVVGAESGEL